MLSISARADISLRAGWLSRMLNVAMRFGAVRMLVGYDTYRNKSVQPTDQRCDGYVHVDVPRLVEAISAGKVADPASEEAISAVFAAANTPTVRCSAVPALLKQHITSKQRKFALICFTFLTRLA
jgi:hypothetical protein